MSIISNNKNEVKKAHAVYEDKKIIRDKAERDRKIAAVLASQVRTTAKEQEIQMIEEMLSIDTKGGMTAKEIAVKMGGKMSKEEIIGNLNAILNSKIKRIRPCFNPSTGEIEEQEVNYKNRYGIDPDRVTAVVENQISYYLPCDADGIPLENGTVEQRVKKVTRYSFLAKKSCLEEKDFFHGYGGYMV